MVSPTFQNVVKMTLFTGGENKCVNLLIFFISHTIDASFKSHTHLLWQCSKRFQCVHSDKCFIYHSFPMYSLHIHRSLPDQLIIYSQLIMSVPFKSYGVNVLTFLVNVSIFFATVFYLILILEDTPNTSV